MWNKIEHDFGNIKAGSTIQYTFENDGSKIIRETNPSCNCISIYHKNNTLRVVWKVRDDVKESYESFKYVYIVYQGGEMEMLTLKATLIP